MSREEILEEVRDVIVEQLGTEREKITESATFIEDLAADSLDVVELIMSLEEKFEIEIPDSDAEKITTVKDVIDYIVDKIIHLRIFDDENGVMNRSLLDVQGSVLSVSQFTLYADTRKGKRPSFVEAARPEQAEPLWNAFNEQLKAHGLHVETGVFGAMMDVSLINDGPVTITIESKAK